MCLCERDFFKCYVCERERSCVFIFFERVRMCFSACYKRSLLNIKCVKLCVSEVHVGVRC